MDVTQGLREGGTRGEGRNKGGKIPRAPNHYGGVKSPRVHRMTAENAEKSQ